MELQGNEESRAATSKKSLVLRVAKNPSTSLTSHLIEASWLSVVAVVQGWWQSGLLMFLYMAVVMGEVLMCTHVSMHASSILTIYKTKGMKQYRRFLAESDIIWPIRATCLRGLRMVLRHW